MAGKGMDLVAMDGSCIAVEKARALALTREVSVDFHVVDIAKWDWEAEPFDLVVAIFIQFAGPELRDSIFQGMKQALKPGGLIMLHGYTPEQIGLKTGGPSRVENMYTTDLLKSAFAGFDIQELRAYQRHVDEGKGHSGMSALIDLVARKPTRSQPPD